MKTTQLRYDQGAWREASGDRQDCRQAQLVLVLGARSILGQEALHQQLRDAFPQARIVSCSSGGEICGENVLDEAAIATALQFDATEVRAVQQPIAEAGHSYDAGRSLGAQLPADGLRHVLVFSEGLTINGSALANGLSAALPASVSVTGGLAADGERFQQTVVGLDAPPKSGRIVAVGFYGDRLQVGMGSLGGWKTWGAERTVTRALGNVIYEFDGQPALPVYKQMLGPYAYGLPATGLLYPLFVPHEEDDSGVVRTLLTVDESAGSLTFAGDITEGRRVQLMRADLDTLIDAAGLAAQRTLTPLSSRPEFALLISCIGRKLLLQLRTREEVRSAYAALGPQATITGFYSYGELSPLTPGVRCELHNQTMTITTFSEAA